MSTLDTQAHVDVAQGRQTVGDHQGGAAAPQSLEPFDDRGLSLLIDGAGRLIKNDDRRVREEGPCQRDTLPLAAGKIARPARQQVADRLTELAPVFHKQKFMLGEEFSMLDVAISPLLWRLDYYGIALPKTAAPLMKYAERLFSRPAFIEALTPSEKVMRK